MNEELAENIIKIDKSVSALLSQVEYLTADFNLPQLDKKRNGYDPGKDKIRSSSDLVWQLSTSISSLMAVKGALINFDKQANAEHGKEDEKLIEFIFGTKSKNGDKK